jgi:hypothetical protein
VAVGGIHLQALSKTSNMSATDGCWGTSSSSSPNLSPGDRPSIIESFIRDIHRELEIDVVDSGGGRFRDVSPATYKTIGFRHHIHGLSMPVPVIVCYAAKFPCRVGPASRRRIGMKGFESEASSWLHESNTCYSERLRRDSNSRNCDTKSWCWGRHVNCPGR